MRDKAVAKAVQRAAKAAPEPGSMMRERVALLKVAEKSTFGNQEEEPPPSRKRHKGGTRGLSSILTRQSWLEEFKEQRLPGLNGGDPTWLLRYLPPVHGLLFEADPPTGWSSVQNWARVASRDVADQLAGSGHAFEVKLDAAVGEGDSLIAVPLGLRYCLLVRLPREGPPDNAVVFLLE